MINNVTPESIKQELKLLFRNSSESHHEVIMYCKKGGFMVSFIITRWGKASNIGPYSMIIRSPYVGAEHLERTKIPSLQAITQDIFNFLTGKEMSCYRPLIAD